MVKGPIYYDLEILRSIRMKKDLPREAENREKLKPFTDFRIQIF